MANEQNLIPNSKRTPEELREMTRKGGIKSGEVRREKKLLKDLLDEALNKGTETDNDYINITAALIREAKKGNVKAFETIRDTLGQKPSEKIELEQDKPFEVNINIRKK